MINKIKKTYFHLGKLQLLCILWLLTFLGTMLLVSFSVIHSWSQQKNSLAGQLDVLSNGLRQDIKVHLSSLDTQFTHPVCDQKTMMAMQQVDYFANFLTNISIVKDDQVICSSTLGKLSHPTLLNEPDWISVSGVKVRQNQNVPFFDSQVTGQTVQVGNFLAYLDYSNAISQPRQPWIKHISYYNNDGDRIFIYGPPAFTGTTFAKLTPNSQWYDDGHWLFSDCPTSNECRVIAIDIQAYFTADKKVGLFWGFFLCIAISLVTLLGGRIHQHLFNVTRQIRHGINRHQLNLHYQPILDMETGKIIGCEVLSRWRTLDGELIRPDEFIAIVEKNSQTRALTEFVVSTCIEDLSQAGLLGKIKVGINAFPCDIASGHIRELLCERLPEEFYSLFSIELTEQKIDNLQALCKGVQDLRKLGVEVAIDDFGTGFSNLEGLRELSVNTLKIDKSFIWGAEKPSLKQNLVEHIVGIAKSLKLNIIAEGVETTEQLEYLRTLDVDYTQGFLHSRPVCLKKFVTLAKTHS